MKISKWFAVGFTLGTLVAFTDKKNRDAIKTLFINLISKIRKEKK